MPEEDLLLALEAASSLMADLSVDCQIVAYDIQRLVFHVVVWRSGLENGDGLW